MSEEPRMPYVAFEVRAIEDRAASEEAGHYVAKDAIFVIITPAGTKDRIEKLAQDWVAGLEEGVKQERIPSQWLSSYKAALKAYEEGQELPENGTPIMTWPALSPAQVKNLINANIRTVEDLAQATDEAINRIGMGGRALKQKAQAWLDASQDTGKVAAEVENLRQALSDSEARVSSLEEQMKTLEAKAVKEKA